VEKRIFAYHDIRKVSIGKDTVSPECRMGSTVCIPWGVIIGPFLGAVLGELLFAGKKAPEAFKAGFGAFLGFILGMIFKPSVCGWFIFCFIKALIAGPDSP
jgi:uncharacterized protein YqgC (DUF456 family)